MSQVDEFDKFVGEIEKRGVFGFVIRQLANEANKQIIWRNHYFLRVQVKTNRKQMSIFTEEMDRLYVLSTNVGISDMFLNLYTRVLGGTTNYLQWSWAEATS